MKTENIVLHDIEYVVLDPLCVGLDSTFEVWEVSHPDLLDDQSVIITKHKDEDTYEVSWFGGDARWSYDDLEHAIAKTHSLITDYIEENV